jgi:hypothetical protein
MPGFREECEHLAPLETFDPAAFREDTSVPQELCNFVLALALIFNDCKDAVYAHVVLAGLKPERRQRSRLWGAVAGAQLHADRAVAGVVHELFELIRANDTGDVIRHPFFVSLVQNLPASSREGWAALTAVARGDQPTDPFGKRLMLLRHKVSFHYDAKALFAGYTQHFLGPSREDERAYISRGNSMRESRFFFADAAATGYFSHLIGPENRVALTERLADTIERINHSLMMIVGAFILRRKYHFRVKLDRRDLRAQEHRLKRRRREWAASTDRSIAPAMAP